MILISSKTIETMEHVFYPGEFHEVDDVVYDVNGNISFAHLKDLNINVNVNIEGFTLVKTREEEIVESCRRIEKTISNELIISKLNELINKVDKLDKKINDLRFIRFRS